MFRMMNNKKKLLIPYFTAGYPELNSTGRIIEDFSNAGADYIEVGLAHSDALADGPVIQEASYVALKNGINLQTLSDQLAKANSGNAKPILFTYYNPILAYGLEETAKLWAASGGKGILVPDLPVEESGELDSICSELGLSLIYLVAPTSTRSRIEQIVSKSKEFIYLVSVTGVTGVRSSNDYQLVEIIEYIHGLKPELPVVIGFGIGDERSALSAISQGADGVVIGSALVRLLKEHDFHAAKELICRVKSVLRS